MFNFGFTEIILLGTIALLVIGPKQLPQVARAVGRLLSEFRSVASDLTSSLTDTKSSMRSHVDKVKSKFEDTADFEKRLMDLIDQKAKDAPTGTVAQGEVTTDPASSDMPEPNPHKNYHEDDHLNVDPEQDDGPVVRNDEDEEPRS